MNVSVRYFSRSGNTEKLALAIAAAVGAKAESVSVDLGEKADILFIGSSVYAGGFDPSIGEFIDRNAEKIGTISVFGTSASGKTNLGKLKDLAEGRGIKVCEREFYCHGKFLFLHKNRPNEDDLAAAASFAKKITDGIE